MLKSCACFWCFHNIFQFSYYCPIIISYFWKGYLSIAKWHESQMNGNDYLFRFQAAFVRMLWSLSWFLAVSITEASNLSSWNIHFIMFHPGWKKGLPLSQFVLLWVTATALHNLATASFPYLFLSVLEYTPFPAGLNTSQSHRGGDYSQGYL